MHLLHNAKDTIDDIIKIIDNNIQLVEKATDSSYSFSLLKDTIRSLLVIIDNRKNIDWGLSDETLKCLVNFVNTKNTNDQSSKASSEVLILKNQI